MNLSNLTTLYPVEASSKMKGKEYGNKLWSISPHHKLMDKNRENSDYK